MKYLVMGVLLCVALHCSHIFCSQGMQQWARLQVKVFTRWANNYCKEYLSAERVVDHMQFVSRNAEKICDVHDYVNKPVIRSGYKSNRVEILDTSVHTFILSGIRGLHMQWHSMEGQYITGNFAKFVEDQCKIVEQNCKKNKYQFDQLRCMNIEAQYLQHEKEFAKFVADQRKTAEQNRKKNKYQRDQLRCDRMHIQKQLNMKKRYDSAQCKKTLRKQKYARKATFMGSRT